MRKTKQRNPLFVSKTMMVIKGKKGDGVVLIDPNLKGRMVEQILTGTIRASTLGSEISLTAGYFQKMLRKLGHESAVRVTIEEEVI